MDLEHYRNRAIAICIHPDAQSKTLPGSPGIRTFLEDFGPVWDIRSFCIKEGLSVKGLPNTAVVVLDSPDTVKKILKSSTEAIQGSFWRGHSVIAESFGRNGHLDNFFKTKVFPRLISKLPGKPPGSDNLLRPNQSQPMHGGLGVYAPPAKRPRTDSFGGSFDAAAAAVGNHASTSKSIRTTSAMPESSDWMRARITQLETELDSMRVTRDMSALEKGLLQAARQAEQHALREAVSQKSAADAVLSRQEVEQGWLRSELETASARESALSNDVNVLRGQLTISEGKLLLAQLSVKQLVNLSERIKALEMELEKAQSRSQKLQLQNSRLEQQIANPDTTELDGTKAKAQQLEDTVKRLESDLTASHEQLESAKKSLESMQRSLESVQEKYSSTRGQYESAKAKLGMYKSRLENEQTIVQQLKDTFTPEVYRSLGATYETLGAFLSITGLPPIDGEEHAGPKKELD
ncbi:hypothetical protein RSOLAG22IIIB_13554 [Rhizoctonia solani]|uniref:Uncharacterized protein n=1 Tax=Rhizoctonia solani TaxID=456999 RepID=A0A0K6FNV0_9AGAM|nr:hypothetical protein RSOLAG22IIIB_13554 [Rhizoctonia solani]